MAKFQRFDSRNKKRDKDKSRTLDREFRPRHEEREARNKSNRQHLMHAYYGQHSLKDNGD